MISDMGIARAARSLPFCSRLAVLKAARAMAMKHGSTLRPMARVLARRYHLRELMSLVHEVGATGGTLTWDGSELHVHFPEGT